MASGRTNSVLGNWVLFRLRLGDSIVTSYCASVDGKIYIHFLQSLSLDIDLLISETFGIGCTDMAVSTCTPLMFSSVCISLAVPSPQQCRSYPDRVDCS